jgi:Flp pilus assembly protein TadD
MKQDDARAAALVFLPLPPALAVLLEAELSKYGAAYDSSIYVPAEIAANGTQAAIVDPQNPETLTKEMFTAGILRFLQRSAKDTKLPEREHSDYYRKVALCFEPNILAEFSAAAIAKVKLNDFESALDIADVLAALFQRADAVLHLRALILEERAAFLEQKGVRQKAELAKAEAQKALRAEESAALAKEVQNLIESENAADALVKIKEAIEARPRNKRLWFLLGWALRVLRRWQDAASALEYASELGAKNVDLQNELSICYVELGRYAEAQAALQKALRADPYNTKTISNLGVLALRRGDKKTAASFFRTVLEYDKDDPLAKKMLEGADAATGAE